MPAPYSKLYLGPGARRTRRRSRSGGRAGRPPSRASPSAPAPSAWPSRGGRTTTGRLEGGNTYVLPDTDDGTASVLSPTSLAPTVCGRALLVIARGVIIVSRVSRGEVYDRCCGHVKFEERPAPSRAPRGQARGRAAGPRPAAGRRPLTKVCVTPSPHPHRPWLFGQQPLRVRSLSAGRWSRGRTQLVFSKKSETAPNVSTGL